MTANPTFEQAFTQQRTADRRDESVRLLPMVTAADRVGFGRVLLVEFRKLTNTLTGRVILGLIGLWILAVSVALTVMFEDVASPGWWTNIVVVSLGATILFPILGILLVTQEWGQRTALTTFSLEPRRVRVLAAKVLVTLAWVLIGMAAGSVATLGAYAIGAGLNDVPMEWTPTWSVILGSVSVVLLNTLMAMGLAMAIMNAPAAIVGFMALPNVLPLIGLMSDRAGQAMAWLDPNQAWRPLMAGQWDGDIASKALVAALVWVVLPMALGVIRHLRREVN